MRQVFKRSTITSYLARAFIISRSDIYTLAETRKSRVFCVPEEGVYILRIYIALLVTAGKSGTRAEHRLRDSDDVRESVRGGDQGPVGGQRYTGVLRS